MIIQQKTFCVNRVTEISIIFRITLIKKALLRFDKYIKKRSLICLYPKGQF